MDEKTEKMFRKLVNGMNMLADRIKTLEDKNELQQKELNESYRLLHQDKL